MIEIFVAKTVEEAKEQAIAAFAAPASEIRFEVLEEPKKGLFGMRRGEAKVRAEYEPLMQQTPVKRSAPAPEKASAPVEASAIAPAAAPAEEQAATAQPAAEKPAVLELTPETEAKINLAKSYIGSILREMGLSDACTVTMTETGAILNFDGDGSGTIIGRRGETLDALQYLASMISNKGDKEYFRISLDSCGYREKRRKTLEALAARIARSVQRTGRSTTLEPMNPYERRIIHSAVAEMEGVTSRSIGEEPHRMVVISSTNARKNDRPHDGARRSNGGDRRGGRNQNRNRGEGPRKLDLSTSFEKDYKRPKPDDNVNAGLYGKIEL